MLRTDVKIACAFTGCFWVRNFTCAQMHLIQIWSSMLYCYYYFRNEVIGSSIPPSSPNTARVGRSFDMSWDSVQAYWIQSSNCVSSVSITEVIARYPASI